MAPKTANDLMRGAIDLHVHSEPDIVPRLMDDLDLAAAARGAGMAAILLKNHYLMTADRARIVQKAVPGIHVFGGLVLNVPACGGLNVDAVRAAIDLGAKAIWLPTISATNYIEHYARAAPGHIGARAQRYRSIPVPVLDASGAPTRELSDILALVADAGVILGTGHLSARETKAVADAALRAGVTRVLVNHPEIWSINMSVDDQRELAARGATFERCICSATNDSHDVTPLQIADHIRAVGAASTVMATDYGQVVSPRHRTGCAGTSSRCSRAGSRPRTSRRWSRRILRGCLGLCTNPILRTVQGGVRRSDGQCETCRCTSGSSVVPTCT